VEKNTCTVSVLVPGLVAGASDSGTINVTIKFQQLFAVDENSCCCSSCRTWAWSGSTCEAIAPGSVLHGATYAAPPDSHRALLKRRSGSRTAPGPPGRNRTGAFPPPSLHFESITRSAAQSSLGTGDVLPAHQGDFLALAEGAKSRYWAELLEAVPLAPGFAPIQFIGEPLGRIFHRDQSIYQHFIWP
jgi:hypothetical protein